MGDEIDVKKIGEKLVELGYKRSTMVSDIAEFSIRGDIIDIYSLDKKPVRIELWGDEVVDLRYFDNETQKSIEKIKEFEILPVHKFVLKSPLPPFDKGGNPAENPPFITTSKNFPLSLPNNSSRKVILKVLTFIKAISTRIGKRFGLFQRLHYNYRRNRRSLFQI